MKGGRTKGPNDILRPSARFGAYHMRWPGKCLLHQRRGRGHHISTISVSSFRHVAAFRQCAVATRAACIRIWPSGQTHRQTPPSELALLRLNDRSTREEIYRPQHPPNLLVPPSRNCFNLILSRHVAARLCTGLCVAVCESSPNDDGRHLNFERVLYVWMVPKGRLFG